MKILNQQTAAQNKHPNVFEKIRRWKSTLPWNNLRVPPWMIFPLFSVCIGAKHENKWVYHIGYGSADNRGLFWNGILFFRIIFCPVWAAVTIPVWIYSGASFAWLIFCVGFVGLGIRWAGKNPSKKEYMQTYIGVKLNGEWAIVPRFRIQSDLSAEAGTTGANYGNAYGWDAGTK